MTKSELKENTIVVASVITYITIGLIIAYFVGDFLAYIYNLKAEALTKVLSFFTGGGSFTSDVAKALVSFQ